MNEAVVIFPNQLFDSHPAVAKKRKVFLLEDARFFSAFRFHKKKLILHRASMQAYRDRLMSQGYNVQYIEFQKDDTSSLLFQQLANHKIDAIYHAEITDHELERRFQRNLQKYGQKKISITTPNFLTSHDWLIDFFKRSSHYSLTHFYIAQRKRMKILVEGGKPTGGKWSFDPENRKKIPRGMKIPVISSPPVNRYVKEAIGYVEKMFPNNPGSGEYFFYPVTHEDAKKMLHDFFKTRFAYFGDYQDAIRKDQSVLFHSVISPALNIGLLDPRDIVEKALEHSVEYNVSLHTVEGFVRQIVGWREFVRALYLFEDKRQRTTNFWNHRRKLPASLYSGTTGIEPLDTVIVRLLKDAYLHHIERLMILGNFVLLCGIDPDEMYRWFMDLFIDAYDWVMVPNVYGLSQYADGGLMTTKPYFSASHYIKKMSDYSEGKWCDVWDALYWTFIDRHRDFFRNNPRLSIMVRQLDRMDAALLKKYNLTARNYLDRL